jgi:alpha/beta hydrolase fold
VITHRFMETNGIRLHLAEAGQGPLVLLHGFPESWYSWRHQLTALAQAGYHAVAADQRGYGQTDRPAEIDKYTQLHLVGDIIGLLDALQEEQSEPACLRSPTQGDAAAARVRSLDPARAASGGQCSPDRVPEGSPLFVSRQGSSSVDAGEAKGKPWLVQSCLLGDPHNRAHAWGQGLTFEGKSCSFSSRAFLLKVSPKMETGQQQRDIFHPGWCAFGAWLLP